MEVSPLLAGYLIAINLLTLIFFGVDKASAASHAWRIRERTLLLLALLGGSPGALLGIKLFRHKTKKDSFLALLALVLLAQVATLLYFFS
jgi:uncharacterized membrane protein YsdA (DUF1294 family)